MATEKQIRANRENAKRSTGPKTTAGRMKSSRNALLHGLSLELFPDKTTISKMEAIAQWVVPDQMDSMRVTAAVEAAYRKTRATVHSAAIFLEGRDFGLRPPRAAMYPSPH